MSEETSPADSQSPELSVEALQKQLADAEEKVAQHWERLLRKQADMDNLQRLSERNLENAHKYALEKFVLELLPVIDGLERAVVALTTEAPSALDGVGMTLKMFSNALEKFGAKSVNPLDQLFNPDWHQAVSTLIDPEVAAGTVLSVLQVGYLLNGRLIRPALVVVSK